MRPARRPDDVRAAIVAGIRQAGARWTDLESPVEGEPDGFASWVGSLTLMEIKSPGGRLSEAQKRVHAEYARHGVRVYVIETLREALDAIGITGPRAEENRRALRSLVSAKARAKSAVGKMRPNVTPAAMSYPRGEPDANGTERVLHGGRDMSGTDGT